LTSLELIESMKKIVTVLGARPQFIKASVVSHAMRQSAQLQEVLVHTGQHFDANISDVFFEELGMHRPDHFLDIHGGSHGAMTGRMLEQVEKVLLAEKPDAVLVYGDTNSTLAGALAAAKLHIPVAHVEAGLRSFNMAMPEEINRVLTDRISRWLFTLTATAAEHLKREGFAAAQIIPVGDVMYHAGASPWRGCTSRWRLVGPIGAQAKKLRAHHHTPRRKHRPPAALSRDCGCTVGDGTNPARGLAAAPTYASCAAAGGPTCCAGAMHAFDRPGWLCRHGAA
jgi:hypothetical protein